VKGGNDVLRDWLIICGKAGCGKGRVKRRLANKFPKDKGEITGSLTRQRALKRTEKKYYNLQTRKNGEHILTLHSKKITWDKQERRKNGGGNMKGSEGLFESKREKQTKGSRQSLRTVSGRKSNLRQLKRATTKTLPSRRIGQWEGSQIIAVQTKTRSQLVYLQRFSKTSKWGRLTENQ